MAHVFISGGTGYLGRRLIPALLSRGHQVRSIARAGSQSKLPFGCGAVTANALDAASFAASIGPSDTFIHLTGAPKPAPWKERQFRAVDLASLRASAAAVKQAGTIRHFIYVSVAHPAPVMRAYIAVRREAEEYLAQAGLVRTILRPWYVLGPGHWWPHALQPFYALASRSEKYREAAARLGLVTLAEMTAALVQAVENPPARYRVIEVPEIRSRARELSPVAASDL